MKAVVGSGIDEHVAVVDRPASRGWTSRRSRGPPRRRPRRARSTGIVKCCQMPGKSMNFRSTQAAFFSLASFRTSFGVRFAIAVISPTLREEVATGGGSLARRAGAGEDRTQKNRARTRSRAGGCRTSSSTVPERRGVGPAGAQRGPHRSAGLHPSARIRSRRVFRFMPSSSAARSWFPLVRAMAAAMSGRSTASSAAW